MEEAKYTIDYLREKTGISIRTIRFYVQEGIIEPPAGRGRGGFYNDSHLQKLQQIQSLQDKGMSLNAIGKYLNQGKLEEPGFLRNVWADYEIIPGLEIRVRRDVEERHQRKILDILKIAQSIVKGEKDNDGR